MSKNAVTTHELENALLVSPRTRSRWISAKNAGLNWLLIPRRTSIIMDAPSGE
jgi:hypothetical protein